ncbi:hypothetical protein BGS_0797 [Beggiatoa sp. SS]|nr:hypothetical protein BGS_0797 [Beggiatoa sp. SS]
MVVTNLFDFFQNAKRVQIITVDSIIINVRPLNSRFAPERLR